MYGDGLLPPVDMSLEKFRSLALRVKKAEEDFGRRKNVILAPSFSYPDGIGENPQEWLKTVKAYLEAGAGSIILDFSERYVPLDRAIKLLEEFYREIVEKIR